MDKHKKYRTKLKKENKCPHCGKVPDINFKTGRLYSECKARRLYKREFTKKYIFKMHEGYIRNLMDIKARDNISQEIIELKREQLRLFRISRGGKRYEKYV